MGYMLQSARGEYIAQNACITGSPLLISLVLASCLNSRSLGSEFEMVVAAVFKFSSFKYLQENKLGSHGDYQEN